MIKYLLLRDNKQSGPYDLDELRTKGLKAYDLVWIEGKSAAWRYPSEVDELKSFAPAVEEQPFDRFYKRPSQTTFTTAPSNNIGTSSGSSMGEPSAVPGKRIIYVTLPSPASRESVSRIPAATGLIAVQQAERSQAFRNTSFQPYPQTQPVPADVSQANSGYIPPEPDSTPIPAQQQHSAVLQQGAVFMPSQKQADAPSPRIASHMQPEEIFSQDREDMWKSTVEMAPRSKGPNLRKVVQPVMVLLCILALLVAGIFIGLSMNREAFGFSPKLAAKDPQGPALPSIIRADHPSSSMPVYTTSVPVAQDSGTHTANTENASASSQLNSVAASPVTQTATNPAPVATPKKKTIVPKEKSPVASQQIAATASYKDSAATGFPALHREAVHRTDANLDKDLVKNNIANLVSAGAGKVTVGAFGGISDVQITVSNRSVYSLDLVVVEVRYIQANKKIFKTENLYFREIGAGAALMQEAPKSSRGIKIEYKVTLINSKELGLSYSGI